MPSQPAPEPVLEHTLHAIDVLLEHPHGAHYLPKAPASSSGVIAFPAALDAKWTEHLVQFPNKALFSERRRTDDLHFLQDNSASSVESNGYSRNQRKSNKHIAIRDFELGEGTPHIYRKKITKKGKEIPPRYAACEDDAFRIIANLHSQHGHSGIIKTRTEINKKYYGITERNIKWVLNACVVCALDRRNKTKPIITPIISEGCLDRVQIDLMDFRAKADRESKWILQVKDHFSCFVWLYPLISKTAAAVAACMDEWFMYNGYPILLHCDNGNEFKGELLTLCQEVGVQVVNGQAYRPQTQGSVESANKIFKRRLTAIQTEEGTHEWIKYMKRIALALNTTCHASLHDGVSPYEVHFGRPPRWTFRGPAALRPGGFEMRNDEEETEQSGDEEEEVAAATEAEEGDDEDDRGNITTEESSSVRGEEEDCGEVSEVEERGQGRGDSDVAECEESETRGTYMQEVESEENENSSSDGYESAVGSKYTDIEQQAGRHKDHARQLLLAREVRQNTVVFAVTEIVTLKIPAKLRGQGESQRMPVRIYSKPYDNGYVVICKWGRLRDIALHEHLNKESLETQQTLGAVIPYGYPEIDGDVLPIIRLTKAVQAYFNRGTIAAGQKNGRKRTRTANALPPARQRPYRRRGPRQPRLTFEELEHASTEIDPAVLDPRLTDEAQEEKAARLEAVRLEAIASERRRKPGFHYEVVAESSEPEFEHPPIFESKTRGARARTEPL